MHNLRWRDIIRSNSLMVAEHTHHLIATAAIVAAVIEVVHPNTLITGVSLGS